MSGACRVLLIGMMGSGKSTIGRLLSDATGWPYLDNDELVRRAHGMTARALLAERGEAGMRAAESAALALGLTMPPPVIVGVAAGVILDPADRAALDDGGIVVWLSAGPEALAARATEADHRPWLDGDALAWVTSTLETREPLYSAVADVEIWTDVEPPEAAADRLRAWLAQTEACGRAIGQPDA